MSPAGLAGSLERKTKLGDILRSRSLNRHCLLSMVLIIQRRKPTSLSSIPKSVIRYPRIRAADKTSDLIYTLIKPTLLPTAGHARRERELVQNGFLFRFRMIWHFFSAKRLESSRHSLPDTPLHGHHTSVTVFTRTNTSWKPYYKVRPCSLSQARSATN